MTWVLLLPYLLGATVLVVVPALVTFALATTDYDLLTPPSYVGLENLARLLDDPLFHKAAAVSAILLAIAVPLRLAGALGAALALHRRFRGVGAARTAVLLPTVVPEVALGLLWLYLLNPIYGPVNLALGGLGLPEPDWLTSAAGAMAAVVLVLAFTIGEGFIVCLAVRRQLPADLHDVARLEGASPWHAFRRVTLPPLAPVLGLLALRDAAFLLQASFVPALVVTQGGPNRTTTFLPLHVYNTAFEDLRYGYAAAMTAVMFALSAAIALAGAAMLRHRLVR